MGKDPCEAEPRITELERAVYRLSLDMAALKIDIASIKANAEHLPEIHHLIEGTKVVVSVLKIAAYIGAIGGAIWVFMKTGEWHTPKG